MCTSLSNEGCGSELKTNLVQPVECTGQNMLDWQGIIKQHYVLNSIVGLYEVADPIQHYQSTQDMACSKMTINIENQDVIIRTCQTAKTEIIDPCNIMKVKLKDHHHIEMTKCDLCPTDACNSTTIVSPDILYILLSFLGSLIHVTFYRLA
ncbi:hypothetical protein EAI_14460 [Harpegnathos saltator]|uniref:Protein quiver n=2 Tax=Harpegnathos saltator TaxID=610380 RepID=E2C3U4_HARSA|nr:hypothetical protein EAI_14460 [Harpegnathos saltator]